MDNRINCLRCGILLPRPEINPQMQMCAACCNEIVKLERERKVRLEHLHWQTALDPNAAICGRRDVKRFVSRGAEPTDEPMCADCRETEKAILGATALDWRNALANGA